MSFWPPVNLSWSRAEFDHETVAVLLLPVKSTHTDSSSTSYSAIHLPWHNTSSSWWLWYMKSAAVAVVLAAQWSLNNNGQISQKAYYFWNLKLKNQIINDKTTILKCNLQLKHGIIKDYVKEINGGRKKWLQKTLKIWKRRWHIY